ncbi:MAG: DEAD/DEAH box helicase [Cyclobacteriaceae bacterium]|nr:DEAD/DEAH box helicase [Cyclobacteriaceae bacterium]
MSFSELGLCSTIVSRLIEIGYTNPREIQEKAIPAVLRGENVMGIASTGTGKTAAFLLPIINELLINPVENHTLVIVPTRELALQIHQEFKNLTRGMGLYTTVLIGGSNIGLNIKDLSRVNHLIIGTPGRLIDLLNRNLLSLNSFNTLVLDEFDRMLDMGFKEDVKKIRKKLTSIKQTLLFSATIDNSQRKIINELVSNYNTIQSSLKIKASENVTQDVVKVDSDQNKFDVLLSLLLDEEKVILFSETKRKVTKLVQNLTKAGIRTGEIHGDISQRKRESALRSFKSGNTKVLVATDVLARGIDITDVSLVINYEIPGNYEDYIHRIGRTGRSGKKGKALTFIN